MLGSGLWGSVGIKKHTIVATGSFSSSGYDAVYSAFAHETLLRLGKEGAGPSTSQAQAAPPFSNRGICHSAMNLQILLVVFNLLVGLGQGQSSKDFRKFGPG